MLPKYIDCTIVVVQSTYTSYKFQGCLDIDTYKLTYEPHFETLLGIPSNEVIHMEITNFPYFIKILKHEDGYYAEWPFIIELWKKQNDIEPIYISDIFVKLKNILKKEKKQ